MIPTRYLHYTLFIFATTMLDLLSHWRKGFEPSAIFLPMLIYQAFTRHPLKTGLSPV